MQHFFDSHCLKWKQKRKGAWGLFLILFFSFGWDIIAMCFRARECLRNLWMLNRNSFQIIQLKKSESCSKVYCKIPKIHWRFKSSRLQPHNFLILNIQIQVFTIRTNIYNIRVKECSCGNLKSFITRAYNLT